MTDTLKKTSPIISAVEPDWSRERVRCGRWDPARKLLKTIRRYQRWRGRGLPGWFVCRWAVVQHRWWSAVCGADIPLDCTLGGGLLLPHPQGIVIHPRAVVGPNCLIFQQVTLGALSDDGGCPSIGGHVDIGAGAKLLGAISVGDHARIGANAVVLCDVPSGAAAVGVPARIVA